jgi:hypothetical protein
MFHVLLILLTKIISFELIKQTRNKLLIEKYYNKHVKIMLILSVSRRLGKRCLEKHSIEDIQNKTRP